jgi:hypothetical protein
MRSAALLGLLALLPPAGLGAQSALERSPNLQGTWGLSPGAPVFILAHRFEILGGGDELFSVPTLTFAVGLPLGLAAGVDFTSYSEVVPGRLTGNEAQYWVRRPLGLGEAAELAPMLAYNSAARSADAALSGRFAVGRVHLFGEGRVFSSLFGSGDAAAAAAVGAGLRLTRFLAATGDVGRVMGHDTIPAAWSAALALEIPLTPHSLSLQVANSGATTLQGASREKTVGPGALRYGFAFTVPLGGRERWRRILSPPPAPAPLTRSATVTIAIRGGALPNRTEAAPGDLVTWVNLDDTTHSLVAADGSWSSGPIPPGTAFGRLHEGGRAMEIHCLHHPAVRGLVVAPR